MQYLRAGANPDIEPFTHWNAVNLHRSTDWCSSCTGTGFDSFSVFRLKKHHKTGNRWEHGTRFCRFPKRGTWFDARCPSFRFQLPCSLAYRLAQKQTVENKSHTSWAKAPAWTTACCLPKLKAHLGVALCVLHFGVSQQKKKKMN